MVRIYSASQLLQHEMALFLTVKSHLVYKNMHNSNKSSDFSKKWKVSEILVNALSLSSKT